jgi:hypothetical protein
MELTHAEYWDNPLRAAEGLDLTLSSSDGGVLA